eukprot:9152903-Karenia_brevis.AAC.1
MPNQSFVLVLLIGKAAEKLADELGGFEKVLEMLQKELGEMTWSKILKEYEKYKDRESAEDGENIQAE